MTDVLDEGKSKCFLGQVWENKGLYVRKRSEMAAMAGMVLKVKVFFGIV